MIIGVPKEIKNREYRCGLSPSHVKNILTGCKSKHTIVVESGCGAHIGMSDQDYVQAGAKVLSSAQEVYSQAQLIVKVKEPQPSEYSLLQSNHILFTYLHLASSLSLTNAIEESGCTAIAYENVTGDKDKFPLLTPMSAVAGRLSIQVGLQYLFSNKHPGKGLLIGGITGVPSANVVIIGCGVVGENAIAVATGLSANVTALDLSITRLKEIENIYANKIQTLYSNYSNIENAISKADLLITSVLVPGTKAPIIITKDMLRLIPKKSVIVDVAIDQGGNVETSRPTTHDDPVYEESGITHYCVSNMPGVVPLTSTMALNNVVTPWVRLIADLGSQLITKAPQSLLNGITFYKGHLVNKVLADSFNKNFTDIKSF